MDVRARRRVALGAGLPVLLGSATAGVTQYAFQVLAARALGSEEFSAVAVIWTIQYLLFAVWFFPLETLVARSTLRGEEHAGPGVRLPTLYVLLVAGAAGAVSWVFRVELFGGSAVYAAVVCASALTSGAYCAVRGWLSGSARYVDYAWLTGGESTVRLALAAGVVLVGATATTFAWTVPAGAALLLLIVVMPRCRPHRRRSRSGSGSARFLVSGIAAGAGAQALLAGGPLLLPAMGATREETSVAFVTLMVLRAPLVVGFSGLLARVLPSLETRARAGDLAAVLLRATCWLVPAFAASGLLAAVAGPWAVGVVFGQDFRPPSAFIGLATSASLLALANLFLDQAVVALDRERRLAIPWGAAVIVAGLAAHLLPGDPIQVLGLAFLGGEVTAAVGLLIVVHRVPRAHRDAASGGRPLGRDSHG